MVSGKVVMGVVTVDESFVYHFCPLACVLCGWLLVDKESLMADGWRGEEGG